MSKKKFKSSSAFLIVSAVIYLIGPFFIEHYDIEKLVRRGYAEQHTILSTDSEGEEHEGLSLISITGIGKVLTFQDIYLSHITLFFLVLILGEIFCKERSYEIVLYEKCVIGVLLIMLISKGNIVSTILFWLSTVASHLYIKATKQ